MIVKIIGYALALNLIVSSLNAAYAFERLDDSASPRSNVEAPLVLGNDGQLLSESVTATTAIFKFGRVDYRLATSAYIGKSVRIYYVIPDAIHGLVSPSGIMVEWQGSQQLSAGSAHAGERKVVWSGTIAQAWFEDSMELQWTVQLDQVRLADNQPFGFEAYFEIEVLP